jgi:predicted RNA methylase
MPKRGKSGSTRPSAARKRTAKSRAKARSGDLFIDQSGQLRLADKSVEQAVLESSGVECLGLTFDSEEARRHHFLTRLAEKLKDPEFRTTEGFPIGSDEDILRLSDPPYFTACPNPFLEELVRHYARPLDPAEPYRREPFAVDVSVGKTDPLYKAHAYHTKVPHLAMVPSVLHYTRPGDIVLDGFAGSGLTGVSVQWCETAPKSYRQTIEQQWQKEGRRPPDWGVRRAILNDLGPAATFIAANYNLPFDNRAFVKKAQRILDEVERELGWMYETLHKDGKTKGRINFTVWSQVFACPHCSAEIVFLNEALDDETKRVRGEFPCPTCKATLSKDNLEPSFETRADPATGEPWKRIRLRPSLIHYSVGKKQYEKVPDRSDLDRLDRIVRLGLPPEVPTDRFPIERMYHGSRLAPKGFTNIHHMFLPRAAHALAALWRKATAESDRRERNMLLFFVEQAIWTCSVLNRYRPTGYSQVNQYLTGVYYVASQHAEVSPWYVLAGKLSRLSSTFTRPISVQEAVVVTTGTCARLPMPDSSVDYVFTDPPFGENIYYADLNFLVEAWHRVRTNAEPEAIVDQAKNKGLHEYQGLMTQCFAQYCRVLKPGRWMTVVFHNSSNAVWNAIQEAMLAGGFVVADVRTLDKQQGSYRQVTSTAVKQDLVISAYKPNGGLEKRFALAAGTEEAVWDFVRTHLQQLPRFVVSPDGRAEVIAERQSHFLYDRMVAFHVLRGVTVPLSKAEFTAGLAQRFPERDGMHFLPDQASEYDRRRMAVSGVRQLELFVSDESSAIQWLRQELGNKPYTLQELTPKFMQEAQRAWAKHEQPLELRDLLEQNFLAYSGTGPIPEPIWAWLQKSSALRRVMSEQTADTADARLRAEAKDRWYVPDPNRATDLEKVRERALLKDFETYRQTPQRKLRSFRLEAVRAGFRAAWARRDYTTIRAVAEKLPEEVLQEDPQLLMWYDQALARGGAGGGSA